MNCVVKYYIEILEVNEKKIVRICLGLFEILLIKDRWNRKDIRRKFIVVIEEWIVWFVDVLWIFFCVFLYLFWFIWIWIVSVLIEYI